MQNLHWILFEIRSCENKTSFKISRIFQLWLVKELSKRNNFISFSVFNLCKYPNANKVLDYLTAKHYCISLISLSLNNKLLSSTNIFANSLLRIPDKCCLMPFFFKFFHMCRKFIRLLKCTASLSKFAVTFYHDFSFNRQNNFIDK